MLRANSCVLRHTELALFTTNDENSGLAEIREAVEYITCHFRDPLEAKGITLASISAWKKVGVASLNKRYPKMHVC